MKDIKVLEKEIKEVLTNYSVHHVSYDTQEGEVVLRVELDEADLTICEEASRLVSSILDDDQEMDGNYILDVCSSGAEKTLYTEEDIQNALNNYVHIDYVSKVDGNRNIEGDLLEITDKYLKLSYKVKNIKKETNVSRENIRHIRLAIKF